MSREDFEQVLLAKQGAWQCSDAVIPNNLQGFKTFRAKNGIIRAYYDCGNRYIVKINDMEILRVVQSPLQKKCYFNDTKYQRSGMLGYYQRMIKNSILINKKNDFKIYRLTNVPYGNANRLDYLYTKTQVKN